MSEIEVKVPEGMLKAACAANDEYSDEGTNHRVLESALRWLSNLSESEFEEFVKGLRK